MFAVFLGQCHGKPGGSGAGRIRVCSGKDAVTRFQSAGRGDFVGYAVAVRHHDGAVCFQRLGRGHGRGVRFAGTAAAGSQQTCAAQKNGGAD